MTLTTKKPKSSEHLVLAAYREISATEFISLAGKNISRDCDAINKRSVAIFFHQLCGGFWWEAVKLVSVAADKQVEKSGKGKSSPKEDLYARLKAENPSIVADRTLNGWGEALLKGAQAEGFLTLPDRVGRQKQPRPSSVEDLSKLTRLQIRFLAEKYQNQTQLRSNLRPSIPEKFSSIAEVKEEEVPSTLPARTKRQKQERRRTGDDPKELKDPPIRSADEPPQNPTKPRQKLRSRGADKSSAACTVTDEASSSSLAVLTQAVTALTIFQPTPECQPLLIELNG